jgi:transcriptional regulator with XRE-family HTH domain
MSQATLAQLAGVNRQNLSDWERGVHEPRASTLMRLARTLRLPLDWFYQNHDGGPGR